jgi:hypothetical protein
VSGLGKWQGRKPLILVRATLLGLLLPQTDDAKADADIYLKFLTMDDAGLERQGPEKRRGANGRHADDQNNPSRKTSQWIPGRRRANRPP